MTDSVDFQLQGVLADGEAHLNVVAAQIAARPRALREAATTCRTLAGNAGSQNQEIGALADRSSSYWSGGASDEFRKAAGAARKQIWDVTQPALTEMESALNYAADMLDEATRQLEVIQERYQYAAGVYTTRAKTLSGWELNWLVREVINKVYGYWIPKADERRALVAKALIEVEARFRSIAGQVAKNESLLDDVAAAQQRSSAAALETVRRVLRGEGSEAEFLAVSSAIEARIRAVQASNPPSAADLAWLRTVLGGLTREDIRRLGPLIDGLGTPAGDTAGAAFGNAIVELYRAGQPPPVVKEILQDPLREVNDYIPGTINPKTLNEDYASAVSVLRKSTVSEPPQELAHEVATSLDRVIKEHSDTFIGVSTRIHLEPQPVADALEFVTRNDAEAKAMMRDPASLFVPASKIVPPESLAPAVDNLFDPITHPPGGTDTDAERAAWKADSRETMLTFIERTTQPDSKGSSISTLAPIALDPRSHLSTALASGLATHIEVLDNQGHNVSVPSEGKLKEGTYQLAVGLASLHGGDKVLVDAARAYGTVTIGNAILSGGDVRAAVNSAGEVYGATQGGVFVAGTLSSQADAAAMNTGAESYQKMQTTSDKAVAGAVVDGAKLALEAAKFHKGWGVVLSAGKELYLGMASSGPATVQPVPFVDYGTDSVPRSSDGAGRAADALIKSYQQVYPTVAGADSVPPSIDREALKTELMRSYTYLERYAVQQLPQQMSVTPLQPK